MSLQPSWYPWPASFNQPTREAGLYAEIVQMRWTPSHFLPPDWHHFISSQKHHVKPRRRYWRPRQSHKSQLPSPPWHVTCNLLEHQIFKYQLEKMINCTTTILSFLQLQVKVYILTHHYPRQLDIKNKRKMRISFPEIQPWTWEKKMIELWIELRMRVKLFDSVEEEDNERKTREMMLYKSVTDCLLQRQWSQRRNEPNLVTPQPSMPESNLFLLHLVVILTRMVPCYPWIQHSTNESTIICLFLETWFAGLC